MFTFFIAGLVYVVMALQGALRTDVAAQAFEPPIPIGISRLCGDAKFRSTTHSHASRKTGNHLNVRSH